MRYSFILLILLAFNCLLIESYAQSTPKYQDVLYMKDKSIIRGTIVYMVPKKQISIKIKNRRTGVEYVKTYQLSEIDKISKEPVGRGMITNSKEENGQVSSLQSKSTLSQNGHSLFNPKRGTDFTTPIMKTVDTFKPITKSVQAQAAKPNIVETPTYLGEKLVGTDPADINEMYKRLNKSEKYWHRDIKGLRTFTEYGYTSGLGKVKNNRFDFTLSLGYQNDPYFYLGIGINYGLSLNNKESILPVFIHPRINFMDNKLTPYLDFKGGYSLSDVKGIYLSPSIGISLSSKGNSSLDFAIGYSYQKAKWSTTDKINPSMRYNKKEDYNGLTIKLIYSKTFWKF